MHLVRETAGKRDVSIKSKEKASLLHLCRCGNPLRVLLALFWLRYTRTVYQCERGQLQTASLQSRRILIAAVYVSACRYVTLNGRDSSRHATVHVLLYTRTAGRKKWLKGKLKALPRRIRELWFKRNFDIAYNRPAARLQTLTQRVIIGSKTVPGSHQRPLVFYRHFRWESIASRWYG